MERRKEWGRNLGYAAFWPLFGLCFYALEWLVPGRVYHVMYHPTDSLIPFCELFVIPYLFWFPFMIFAYVYAFFTDAGAFRRMMRFTALTYGGGLLMFILFPTCQNLRPQVFPRDNFLTAVMAWFYTCDTSTNVCPSLHVCGSLAAAFGHPAVFDAGLAEGHLGHGPDHLRLHGLRQAALDPGHGLRLPLQRLCLAAGLRPGPGAAENGEISEFLSRRLLAHPFLRMV